VRTALHDLPEVFHLPEEEMIDMVKRSRLKVEDSRGRRYIVDESRLQQFARKHPKLFFLMEPFAVGMGMYNVPLGEVTATPKEHRAMLARARREGIELVSYKALKPRKHKVKS